MIRAIFFDLDGTLIGMDEPLFDRIYFSTLTKHLIPYGYDPKKTQMGIYKGVEAMMKNNSGKSNEEVFWDTFNAIMGKDCKVDIAYFDEYYRTQFHNTLEACKRIEQSRKVIDYCRENFEYIVLSTNPLFPAIATEIRMGLSDLKPSDFDLVTTYENFGFCKPNPKYFLELMRRFNLKPEEVLVVGNNTLEDCECALSVGVKGILLKGYIIYNPKAEHTFEEIEIEDLIDYLKKLK